MSKKINEYTKIKIMSKHLDIKLFYHQIAFYITSP